MTELASKVYSIDVSSPQGRRLDKTQEYARRRMNQIRPGQEVNPRIRFKNTLLEAEKVGDVSVLPLERTVTGTPEALEEFEGIVARRLERMQLIEQLQRARQQRRNPQA